MALGAVLWVSNETPDRYGQGGQRRQYWLIEALRDAGLDVHIVSLAGAQSDASARLVADVTRIAPPSQLRRHAAMGVPELRRLANESRVAAIVISHIDSMPLMGSPRGIGKPVILDFHNVYSRWQQGRNRTRAWVWRRRERAALRRTDLALACTQADVAALRALGAKARVELVPHGIDIDQWRERPLRNTTLRSIAMFGSWFHAPNSEGAEWFAREVWPAIRMMAPECQLLVAGVGQPPRAVVTAPGAVWKGRVDDLPRFLASASVIAIPVRSGMGGPIKLAEALASGTPTVTTAAVAADVPGLCVSTDDAECFAEACIGLVSEPREAALMGERARAFALRSLPWREVARPLVDACRAAVAAQLT